MTPNECKAARALLDITQNELAEKAGLGISSIVDFEKRRRNLSPPIIAHMQCALEKLGIEFLKTSNASGVRFRKAASSRSSVGVDPAQLRAARALLVWNQDQLASAANVSRETIKRFEEPGAAGGYIVTIEQIRDALHRAHIQLIDNSGVLLAKR